MGSSLASRSAKEVENPSGKCTNSTDKLGDHRRGSSVGSGRLPTEDDGARMELLEEQTRQLIGEMARLKDDFQRYRLAHEVCPPSSSLTSLSPRPRGRSSTLSEVEFQMTVAEKQRPRGRSSTVSEVDFPMIVGGKRRSPRDMAPSRSPGTESIASTRSTFSNRPRRRHIVYQMSEIEAYGKGLNPHDTDSLITYAYGAPSQPTEPVTQGRQLSCMHSVSDMASNCDCEGEQPDSEN